MFKTLVEAIILVAIVVLVFLQSWRSTLIPLTAVPVAIIGTFAVMAVMGFSLNNLTLFGLVLAIGIVVDDAIVVVEAVEHHIEEGMTPKQAAIKAMEEVSGPVIAVALVLSAVFVPCAFITRHHRPVLPPVRPDHRRLDDHLGAQLADAQPGAWRPSSCKPQGGEARLDRPHPVLPPGLVLLAFQLRLPARDQRLHAGRRHAAARQRPGAGRLRRLLGLTYWGFNQLPTGYIPSQDKGYLLVSLQLPDATVAGADQGGASHRVDEICQTEKPGVGHTIAIAGQSFILGAFGPNFGQFFVPLKPFDERTRRRT